MKKLVVILTAVLISASLWAQFPEKLSYQAVIRNSSNAFVTSTVVSMQISILQGSVSGSTVYVETQNPTTNANGLISLEIGTGTIVSGDFKTISWANGPYFIKTETDPTGGTNYTIVGTNQLMSVPYALHAKTVESVSYNDLKGKPVNIDDDKTDDVNLSGNQTIAGNKTFTGTTTIVTPVNPSDAATKAYVDVLLARIDALEAREEAILIANGFTDPRDGNHYDVVKIGNQIWMAENLAYLPSVNPVTNGSETAAGSYYYVYGYNGTNVAEAKATPNYTTYGVLYNWTAAMNGEPGSTTNPSGVQGICPKGWHLPSDEEWKELEMSLGMSRAVADGTSWRGTNEGSKLAGNAGLWSNGALENNINFGTSGFKAIPAGSRTSFGTFKNIGTYSGWWSATEGSAIGAWLRDTFYDNCYIYRAAIHKASAFPVRCVKD